MQWLLRCSSPTVFSEPNHLQGTQFGRKEFVNDRNLKKRTRFLLLLCGNFNLQNIVKLLLVQITLLMYSLEIYKVCRLPTYQG